MPNRSARTGRYISNAAAARHPKDHCAGGTWAESFDRDSPSQRRDGSIRHPSHCQAQPWRHGN